MQQQIKVVDRRAGYIHEQKNVFITHRTEKHWFRIFNGFGINKNILTELYRQGIPEVWIFYKKDGVEQLWKAKVADWIMHGKEWEWKGNYTKGDQREHLHGQIISEMQLVLSKEYFEVI